MNDVSKQEQVLASVIIDSLAELTANQAMIIELLYQGLQGLSDEERETVTKCASNNYSIAEQLQLAKNRLADLSRKG